MFHTTLCSEGCAVAHHDVIIAIQSLAPRINSSQNATIFSPTRTTRGNNKEDFKKQVEILVSSGWKKNRDVPDDGKELQLPLLHLVSMFGKYEAVEWLLNEEDFDATLRTSTTNETALHLVARHLFKALSARESRLENMSATAKAANFEKVAVLLVRKEVSLFWAKGGLNRETALHILANQLIKATFLDVDLKEEDRGLVFYSKSITAMFKLLLAAKGLTTKDIVKALGIRNGEGSSSLHIIARAGIHGYKLLKYLAKSLGSTDVMKVMDSKHLTVLDIVNEFYPGHDKELHALSEGKRNTMALVSTTLAADDRTPPATAPRQIVYNKEAVELVDFLHTHSKEALKLCHEPVPLNCDSAQQDKRCAIHTKYFPGTCSQECFDTMAAVATIINTHTPLCPAECDLQHHLLTCAVFHPSVVFRTVLNASIPLTFKLCLQSCFNAGWKQDMDVPDPLESLRLPLLHLICMRGNFSAAEKLAQEMELRPVVSSGRNETPLHVAARYFPITYPDKIIADDTFKSVMNFLVKQDKGIIFKVNAQNESVLHVICHSIISAFKVLTRPSENSYHPSLQLKQKNCYMKGFKLVLDMLLDLQSEDKVCKGLICKLLAVRNDANNTFIDVLRKGSSNEIVGSLVLHVKEEFPFCFADGNFDVVITECPLSCPCNRKAVFTRNLGSQVKTSQLEGGNSSTGQEPVSSSQIPSPNVDHKATNQPQPAASTQTAPATNSQSCHVIQPPRASGQPVQVGRILPAQVTRNQPAQVTYNEPVQYSPTQPPQMQDVQAAASSRKPQAQVQSMQVLRQATASSSSQQTFPVAKPTHHIPVVIIKQEPGSEEHNAECCYTSSSHCGAYPSRQNAVIITSDTPDVSTAVQNPLTAQTAQGGAQQGNPPLCCSSPLKSSRQINQAVTNGTAALDSSLNVSTQTAAVPHRRGRGRPYQAVESSTGTAVSQTATKTLPQSEQQKITLKVKDKIVAESLDSLSDTDYKLDLFHTPFCDENCCISHHHLILTLLSTSNRMCANRRPDSFLALLENTKVNFLKCVKKNLTQGLCKDDDLHDDLDIFQYPLIHVAALLLKYTPVDMLNFLGFKLNSCSQKTGEFPLHATLRYCYEAGMKVYRSPGYFERLFPKVFESLSKDISLFKLLSQQDTYGDTPLHVAAKKIIERPGPTTTSTHVIVSPTPDSTQECHSCSSQTQPATRVSLGCNPQARITTLHQHRANFYTSCLVYIFSKLREVATKSDEVILSVVKPVLTVRNKEGETFLQIMCKEHHIAVNGIISLLANFPLPMFYNCIKQCVPRDCWPDIVKNQHLYEEQEIDSGHNQNEPVSSPLEVSMPPEKERGAQPSKPESPKPSSDVSLSETTVTVSPTAEVTIAEESISVPSPATPQHSSASAISPTLVSCIGNFDSVLTPLVANPVHTTLRPTTKRKIIEVLKEEYTERLALAVKGRCEVEEDISKHKSKTKELTESIAKKKAELEKLEKEVQEMQKEMWHKNQAIQALENSLEQFSKEEAELEKNLHVLQEADLEPPAKMRRIEESSCSE
ncbi:uncharacterized protein LOC111345329 [Stylophora pistillata]|uniref:Uncharacterized protein n=1 Tax=Stylophora pistillata TaxID=50429 RepID=A0A2B4SUD7_STYPI|nr:uncharacterized protein LOC111345329 [Stylophora pistillata]PFX32956.1 hypothetical protein AWC38_SpisGene2210 [Stylophora pistillata]